MNTMTSGTSKDLRLMLCPTPMAFTNGFENPRCFSDCVTNVCPLSLGQGAVESTVSLDTFTVPAVATQTGAQSLRVVDLPRILISGL